VSCLPENLPYFGKHMDLSIAYNVEEGTKESIHFEYLNLIAAYMLHALAESQSMGKLLYAFKNVQNMEKFLEENTHAPDGNQPILTRKTMAYAAISLSSSISCVCLHGNNNILKGRASAAYERAMFDLENMTDATWHSLPQHVLIQYVTLLTNPEGPAPSAPTLTRKEIIKHDSARKEASAAAIAAAAAAAADGGGDGSGGGDGGGDGGSGDADGEDTALGQNGEDEAAQPAAAKAAPPPCATKSKAAPAAAAPAPRKAGGEVSLLWPAFSPGTIAMVAREKNTLDPITHTAAGGAAKGKAPLAGRKKQCAVE
jgi:hypothetical protein